jgi:26S proteasome regulatory subunit N5
LVVSKTIYAKIDRLAGIISFQRNQDPNEVLNEWSGNINDLLELIGKTGHLITKEEMVHRIAKAAV